MKKARGILEFALIAMVVVVIAIVSVVAYNNLKLHLANMSKVNLKNNESKELTANAVSGASIGSVSDVETAGSAGTKIYRDSESANITNSIAGALKDSAFKEELATVSASIQLNSQVRIDLASSVSDAIIKSYANNSTPDPVVPASLIQQVMDNMNIKITTQQEQTQAQALATEHAQKLVDNLVDTAKNLIGNVSSLYNNGNIPASVIAFYIKSSLTADYIGGIADVKTAVESSDGTNVSTMDWGGNLIKDLINSMTSSSDPSIASVLTQYNASAVISNAGLTSQYYNTVYRSDGYYFTPGTLQKTGTTNYYNSGRVSSAINKIDGSTVLNSFKSQSSGIANNLKASLKIQYPDYYDGLLDAACAYAENAAYNQFVANQADSTCSNALQKVSDAAYNPYVNYNGYSHVNGEDQFFSENTYRITYHAVACDEDEGASGKIAGYASFNTQNYINTYLYYFNKYCNQHYQK